MRVEKLTFRSERSGTSQDRKPPLSFWDRTAHLSPVFWDLEWGCIMILGAPDMFAFVGKHKKIIKSYFITANISVLYEDVCFDLKVYFFLLILKEMKTFPRALGTVPAVPDEQTSPAWSLQP